MARASIRPADTTAGRLLLAACRGAALPASPEEWDRVIALAQRHEVTALAFQTLQQHRVSAPGVDLGLTLAQWRHLEQRHVIDADQHELLGAEIALILDALADVPILMLKGPALGAYLYPGTFRSFNDIDIAVHEEDLARARNALLGRGYTVEPPADEKYRRVLGKDLGLTRRDETGRMWSVELHWRLAEPTTLPLDEMGVWRRAQTVHIAGRPVRTPGPEDTLILLALNLRKHRFTRLKTLCDVDRLLRRDAGTLNWDVVHQQAHLADACAVTRHTLDLAHALLGSPLAPYPWCGHATGLPRSIFRRLVNEDFLLLGGREGPAQQGRRVLLRLMPFITLDHASTTLRLVLRRIMLTPEVITYHFAARGDGRSWHARGAPLTRRRARATGGRGRVVLTAAQEAELPPR